jgi:ketosteroid isomerase-like protein
MSNEVLELVHRWAAAEQANDAEQLDGVLAQNFVGVGPVGFVLNREQWLARFANGLVNSAFVVEDPVVHDHGSAAVVIGVDAQRTTFGDNQDNSGRFRVSLTVVKAADEWRLASVHLGPLQQRPV